MASTLGNLKHLPREVWALLFVRFVASAGGFVAPFLAMVLSIKLGYDNAHAGIFMTVVQLLGALGLVLGGKLGDAFGRRRTLLGLGATAAITFLACGLVGFRPGLPFLVALGLGALNGSWPCINAVVADVAPPEHLKTAFSLLYWGNNLGFSVGPLLGGYLFTQAPRWLFLGNALALAMTFGAVALFVRETKPAAGVHHSEETAQESTLQVLRSEPVLALYAGLCVLSSFIYFQHTFALPFFLKDLLGDQGGPRAFGTVMAVNGLVVVLGTVPLTMLTRRVPSLVSITLSSAIYILGFGSLAFATGLPFVLATTAFWTLGEILGATNGNAFVAERATPSHRARLNSVIATCFVVGSAVSPLVAGFVTRAQGTRAVWFPVAAIAALATLGYFLLHRFDVRRRIRLTTSAS